jgi:hypothetical protein
MPEQSSRSSAEWHTFRFASITAGAQGILLERYLQVVTEGPTHFGRSAYQADKVIDRADGQPGCNGARCVPTQPVGHKVQTATGICQVTILIRLTFATSVGQSSTMDHDVSSWDIKGAFPSLPQVRLE